jgi:hypothetical protein
MGVLWSNQEGGEDKNSGKAEISAPKVTENVKETFEFPKVNLGRPGGRFTNKEFIGGTSPPFGWRCSP